MRNKIAFLYSAECHGGLIKSISLIINSLNPNKFECLVYCLESEAAAIKLKIHPSIRVSYLNSKRPFEARLVREIIKQFNEDGVQIISTHGFKANFYTFLIRIFRGDFKALTIVHGWVGSGSKLQFYHLLDKIIIRSFDRIIAVSVSQLEQLEKIFISKTKVRLVANGIDYIGFRDRLADAKDLKDDPRFKHKKVIGCCLRLEPEKKVNILIDAYCRLVNEDNCLVIVGEGSARAELEAYARGLGVGEDVHFVGYQADVVPYYKLIDIYVTTSEQEGMPNNLLEAMAAARAIVASDLAVHRRMLANQAGLIFPKSNVYQLVEQLSELMMDAKLRKDLGALALEQVTANYTLKQRIEKLESNYLELC